jgi:hypothetical protein
MEGPVITMAAGETLFFDGRPIKFQTSARIALPHGCRFIRERDLIVPPDTEQSFELETYLAVQAAHLATRAEYARLREIAVAKLAELGPVLEAQLAARALSLNRTHHALVALRPLVHIAQDADEPALCA